MKSAVGVNWLNVINKVSSTLQGDIRRDIRSDLVLLCLSKRLYVLPKDALWVALRNLTYDSFRKSKVRRKSEEEFLRRGETPVQVQVSFKWWEGTEIDLSLLAFVCVKLGPASIDLMERISFYCSAELPHSVLVNCSEDLGISTTRVYKLLRIIRETYGKIENNGKRAYLKLPTVRSVKELQEYLYSRKGK